MIQRYLNSFIALSFLFAAVGVSAFDHVTQADSYTLVEGKIESNQTVFDIQSTSGTFRLRFGDWVHYETAANSLLRLQGLAARHAAVAKDLKLYLGTQTIVGLAKFWAVSPVKVPWSKVLSDPQTDERGTYVIVKKAMLEKSLPIEGSWKWNELAPEQSAALRLAAAWMGCEEFEEQKDLRFIDENGTRRPTFAQLRRCLGHGRLTSSPSLFSDKANVPAGVSRAEIEAFAKRTEKWDEQALISVFEGAGFPKALARIYSSKLVSRRNAIVSQTNAQALSFSRLDAINDAPYVIQGEVKANYPEFPVEIVRSTLEAQLMDVASSALKNIDSLARTMLQTLPYVPIEMFQVGKVTVGPGFVLRLKRRVHPNPSPQGVNDIFLVRDELDLGLSIGFGVNRDLPFGSAWAGIGPGYLRRYVRVFPAASKRAAKEAYWSLPYDLIMNQDFTNLKPGEAFAIQHGWLGSISAGGTIRTGYIVRPSGYVMSAANWLSSFEVYRPLDGSYLISEGYDHNTLLSAKGFWRLYTRYIRTTFASFVYQWGKQGHKTYQVSQAEAADPVVQATLVSRDLEGLQRFGQARESLASYTQMTRYLTLYFWTGRTSKSLADIDLNETGKPRYSIAKFETSESNRFSGRERSWACEVGGALAFANASAPPSDGGVKLKCHFGDEQMSREEAAKQLVIQAAALGLPADSVRVLEPARAKGEAQLLFHLVVPWASLEPLIANVDVPSGWYADYLKSLETEIARDRELDAKVTPSHAESNRRLDRFHFVTSLQHIRSASTPAKRLQRFVDAIGAAGPDSRFTAWILKLLPERYGEIEISVANDITSENLSKSVATGKLIKGPALEFYEKRESLGGKPLIDGY